MSKQERRIQELLSAMLKKHPVWSWKWVQPRLERRLRERFAKKKAAR